MRVLALTLTAALLAGLWLACGDDYQENGPLTGDVGAKCFPDGSCKAGLLCLSELCVAPPEAGTSSGSTSSSGSSGSSEAGTTSEAGSNDAASIECNDIDQTGLTPGVACEATRCDVNGLCCGNAGSEKWTCSSPNDCNSLTTLACDSPADCKNGEQCCFTVTLNVTSCTFGSLSRGACQTSCPSKTFALCDPMHPCVTPGACKDRTLVLQGGSHPMRRGLCDETN